MLDRKTSEHRRPMASLRGTPVISSAARLNEVTRQSESTVKTPSEMLSRMVSVEAPWPEAPAGERLGRRVRRDMDVVFIGSGVTFGTRSLAVLHLTFYAVA
jgi:hypothetical protein